MAVDHTLATLKPRSRRNRLPWSGRAGVWAITLILALPVAVIVFQVTQSSDGIWDHLVSSVLSDYLINSLLLVTGVGLLSLLLGVSTAWLVAMCDFTARRQFEWALMLPLAIPAYIIAYTYTGLLDVSGPVQSSLRELFSLQYGEYWFPQIRSMGGAILMMSLVLYPYVYLLSRAAFTSQSICVLDVSRSLGNTPWQGFARVALPLARPAMVAGVSLVIMETLADYGTVHYFGISTFTTGIFRTWYGLGSLTAASQLASLLLLLVVVLHIVERLSRKRARYHSTSQRHQAIRRYRLSGWRRRLAITWCLLIVLAGFLIPAVWLLVAAISRAGSMLDATFLQTVGNTLALAAMAAVLAVGLALLLAYARRRSQALSTTVAVGMTGMGYAVPGTVIAVGVVVVMAFIDHQLVEPVASALGMDVPLLLSGSVIGLLLAYLVRFMAVALQSVESGLSRLTMSMDEAGRLSGRGSLQLLHQVHLPLLRGSLLTAALLVFVDVMKELPATLILRPFNFNTLAVRSYELASDERLHDAALPALCIVAAGIIPVILLSRSITRSRHERPA